MLSLLLKMNVNALYYVFKAYGASGFILGGVSFLTSIAISVDRLLALLLGLRYRQVVTLKRVCAAITCFWLFGASLGWIWVWRLDIALKGAFVVIILSLVTSIICYTWIYLKLRRHQAQVPNNVPQGQPNGGGIPLNIARYKKLVSSIMWVQLALVACYVPFCISAAAMPPGKIVVAWFATETLVYLNSSLNPILYCWKIREVRQAVKDTIRRLNCF